MKIGIVCYPTVGGSGVVATEVAIRAARAGHDVHLLSYDRPSRLLDDVPGLTFHRVNVSAYPLFRYPPYALALATRMLEVKEDAGVDVFHVHYAIPHAVSAVLADAMSGGEVRFITTLHGTDITVVGADAAYARPTRYAIEASDVVTAVSQYLVDETVRVFGTTREIEVVPNFVDTERFKPGKMGRFWQRKEARGERIVVHASNFRPVKRTGDVVRAFAAIAQALPARLVLAGEGPDLDHALAIASDLGCSSKVECLGNVDPIEQVLGDADLFLSASETESFGLSMLEALSCGVPCVSTDVGGVNEVFGSSPGGHLTPLNDPAAMAEAGIRLLRDADDHAAASAAARERALHFDERRVIERYFELYERAMKR